MLKRRILQFLVAAATATSALLGGSAAATAAGTPPTAFHASVVHSGGAGATAAVFQGGLIWGARSVTLNTPRLWVAAGECASVQVDGYQGNTKIDGYVNAKSYCPPGAGEWYRFSDILLDGSAVSGGITAVYVYVSDDVHFGVGRTDCLRVASTCTEDTSI